MLRVEKKRLIERGSTYYFDDDKFNGVCYEKVSDKEILAYELIDGSIVDDYVSSKGIEYSDGPRVDYSSLSLGPGDEDIQHFLEREPFTGLAYEFEGDKCIGEYLFKEGWIQGELGFYETGELEFCSVTYKDVNQYMFLSQDKYLEKLKIRIGRDITFELTFNEYETLYSVLLDSNQVSLLKSHKDAYLFPLNAIFDQNMNLKEFCPSSDVTLVGAGIDDSLIDHFIPSKYRDHDHGLALYKTSVSENCIQDLKTQGLRIELLV